MSIYASAKAKNKVAGIRQVSKALVRDNAKTVYVAKDADANVLQPLRNLCNSKGITIIEVGSKFVLGQTCGIKSGTAAVAILKS